MQQTVDIGRNDDKYTVLYVRRSPFDQKIQRGYQKLSEFMSTLGEIIELIFIIFNFVFKKYNEVNLQIDLINQLYEFQLDETSPTQNQMYLNQQDDLEVNHQTSKKKIIFKILQKMLQ
ncbi:hypothetical protein ABPG72_009437 [Tetrahymena utriculariae]